MVQVHLNLPGGVTAEVQAAAERGLGLAMEHLLAESLRVVPLRDGPLQNSGVASTDGPHGAVSYDTPYAVRQHEELSYQHLPGRTAKYLETPFNRELPTMLALIAAEVRRGLA